MSYAAAHSAIRERFEDQWGSTTSVQMPNVKFDKPDDEAWVRVKIEQTGSRWASFGDPDNNVERNVGQVTVQIFTLNGEGEGAAIEYADQVRAIFRSWSDSASVVRFLVPPYARQVGSDKKWYQINVVAQFQFDDYT